MPKRKIGSIDTNLGRNLSYFRKLEGLTQQQVADLLNINRTTYTKYETGVSEPNIEILKNLSKILHVDVSMLLADEPEGLTAADVGFSNEERFQSVRRQLLSLSEEDWEVLGGVLDQLSGKQSTP